MADYNIHEIFNRICEIIDDGYHCVDIAELEEDDEYPTCLNFAAYDPNDECSVDYGSVDSIEEELNHVTIQSDDYFVGLTLDEAFDVQHALDICLEHYKEFDLDPKASREEKRNAKSQAISLRNLQAKLAKLLKNAQSK